ncbi:MAG TPA: phytoene/squalene synthase family protein [Geminicoccaceae bacterium]|nr:phytoene/squalene synthase family protein [Geminicoccaceae bacterium]
MPSVVNPENRPAPSAEPAALSYAAGLVRRHDADRFLCALFAPAERREALFALYAFNHEVAKIGEVVGSGEPMAGLIRLQWWRDALAAIDAGHAAPLAHPVVDALRAALARHPLPREPFARLIDGREFDLERRPPADLAALEAYLEATSSELTRLALGVLGAASEPALEAGRRVGLAWGLTGHLRAIPFHAGRGRLYLPADLLLRHGVEARAVLRGEDGGGLRRVVADLAERARGHLRAARANRRGVPDAALPALLPAALADAYLRRLRRSGYAPFATDLSARPPLAPLALLARQLTGRF